MNLLLKIEEMNEKSLIKKMIDKKSERFKKYISDNSKLTWNYFFENGYYFSEVKISGFQGPVIKARASSTSQFKVINEVVEKVEKQLNKKFGQKKPIRKKIDHNSFIEQ
jgi:ribosomal subunit interface protein